MDDMILRATRLTRANRLIEATALIQSVLRGDVDQRSAFETPLSRNSDADKRHSRGSAPEKDLEFVWRLQNPTYAFQHYSTHGLQTWTRSGQFSTTDIVPAGGTFIEACYANAAGNRAYKLYIPSGYKGQKLPLIIMLHGGTQTADDFAGGTRMNVYGENQNYLVVYPVQPPKRTPPNAGIGFAPMTSVETEVNHPSLRASLGRS